MYISRSRVVTSDLATPLQKFTTAMLIASQVYTNKHTQKIKIPNNDLSME